jgi:hypothetical protein
MDVYNKLIVTGTPSNIESMKRMLGMPGYSAHKADKTPRGHEVFYSIRPAPSFMLTNILAPAFEVPETEKTWSDVTMWNMVNWGVDEEVTSARLFSESFDHLVYRFCTHKNAPLDALEKLSYMYSYTTLYLETSHKDGAGVRGHYMDGEYTNTGNWDSPTTHRGFERIRGEKSCECNTADSPFHPTPYFDCPHEFLVDTGYAVSDMEKASSAL